MKLAMWCALLSLLLIDSSANAAVQAWLDNTQIVPGDTVQLTLQHDGSTNDQPDLSPLKQDFDILSTSSSNSVNIINGSTSSQTQLQLTISPKHSGALTVPAIAWGNEHSAPLTLNVNNAASGGSQGAARNIFMETTVDQSQPYVQAGVKVTVRLYTAQQLYQAALDLPISSDAVVQQVGSDQSSSVEKNGQRYSMLERHYLVFPQRSGKLTLPGAVLNAQVATRDRFDPFGDDLFGNMLGNSPLNGMLTRAKPVRVHGDSIELNVRPRPAGATAAYWLPARNVSVAAQWHPESLQVHAGEPLTVDLQLQAEGLTAAQLPDLSQLLTLPPDLKMYPDQAKLSNNSKDDTVLGSREQSIALIADQAGKFTLPEINVQWWDTQANQLRETRIPSQVLTVLPPVGGQRSTHATATPLPADASTNENVQQQTSIAPHADMTRNGRHWLWLSVGLAALWIATVAAWYWSRRRSTATRHSAPPTQVRQEPRLDTTLARNDFYDACRRNDAPAARHHLLSWLAAAWPGTAPVGLRGFARQLNDANLTTLLLALDRACYADANWLGMPLMEALRDLPKRPQQDRDREPMLAALYH